MTWWDWADPTFTLTFAAAIGGVLAAVAAIIIPVILFVLARRGNAFVQEALAGQRRALEAQQVSISRSRRDELLRTLPTITDPLIFELHKQELAGFNGDDGRQLRRAVRLNPLEPLPRYRVSPPSDEEVLDFIASLPNRYNQNTAWYPFTGLMEFLTACGAAAASPYAEDLADLLTGPCAATQAPIHRFYSELVAGGAWYLVSPLLNKIAPMPESLKGLRLNVLTGVLLGLRTLELDQQVRGKPSRRPRDYSSLLLGAQTDLASLLFGDLQALLAYDALAQSLPTSELQQQRLSVSEPRTATVAWLIRAVGVGCGRDAHIDMRCVQNLSACVRLVVAVEQPTDADSYKVWGMDEDDVRYGLQQIRDKRPGLWGEYGADLLASTGVAV